MRSTKSEALAILRLIGTAMIEGVDREDRHLVKLHREAVRVLEEGAHRRETIELAGRVEKLESELVGREPGERAAIIQQRLGLSKSAYYRLRRLAISPASKWDSQKVQ